MIDCVRAARLTKLGAMKSLAFSLCLALVSTSVVACKSATKCSDWAGGYGERSTVTWDKCADNAKREVICELQSPGKYTCQCFKAGTVEKSFDRTTSTMGDKNEATKIANDACEWNLSVQ